MALPPKNSAAGSQAKTARVAVAHARDASLSTVSTYTISCYVI